MPSLLMVLGSSLGFVEDDRLIPCPICGSPLSVSHGPGRGFVDCPDRHRSISDPAVYREALVRARIRETEAVMHPDSSPECGSHDWSVIERTPSMNLLECRECRAWIMGPPG